MAGVLNFRDFVILVVVALLLWTSNDSFASESCSQSSECTPGVVCRETTCDCSATTISSVNASCSECNATALLTEPCCCDFIPYCIMKQNIEPQLRIHTQVIDDVNGYQQTKAEVFLLKNNKYVRVSSIILAAESCESSGAYQAIQIIQAEDVCEENVTSDVWPTYSDWEMDEEGNTVYPQALANENGSCYGDTSWQCNGGICAYTSSAGDPITQFDPSEHYDWCTETGWTGCTLTSSSNLTESYGARYGRLDYTEPGIDGGWAPDLSDTEPFIQIRFSEVRTVIGVLTQGMAANFNRRIEAFQIAYLAGDKEFFIMRNNERMIFNSSVRFNSKNSNLFEPIVTTLIKLAITEPESLYLIGGRVSVIETANSVEKNNDVWNALQSNSPTWYSAANELLAPLTNSESNNWTVSAENGYNPLDIPALIENRVENIAKHIEPGENVTIVQPNFVLVVQRSTSDDLCNEDYSASVKTNHYSIPSQFFCEQHGPDSDNSNVTIGVSTFSTLGEILNQIGDDIDDDVDDDDENDPVVASDIISVVVYTDSMKESVPFRFTLAHTVDIPSKYTTPTCKFWDVASKKWSSFGCVEEENTIEGETSCYCNHTTSFSILMSLSPSPKYDLLANILTYCGLGLSVTSLIISLVVFFVLRRSLTADRVMVHVNLMVAILLADLIFLGGIDQTEIEQVCKAVAFLLHFLYAAVTCWMLVEGVHLYRQIIRVFESERPRTWIYYFVGWGIPAVIVSITGGIKFDSYGHDKACWLSVSEGAIWAFIGPAIPVLLLNLVILLIVVKTVIVASKKQKDIGQIQLIKAGVRSSILLLPLLGIPWLLGPFVLFSPVLVYIFDFLNTLQGFFIALFYCFLNSEVRGSIQQSMRKSRDSQNASYSHSSDEKKTRSSATIRKVRVSPAPPASEDAPKYVHH